MLKSLTLLIAIACSAISVAGQTRDTSLYDLKYLPGSERLARLVEPGDSVDHIMNIFPADFGDDRLNVKEYYPDGHLKTVAKAYVPPPDDFGTYTILLDGSCITFYPDGKRSSIATYSKGNRIGYEYQYYQSGGLYARIKNTNGAGSSMKTLFVDCYTPGGRQTCTEGNGYWTIYNEGDLNSINFEGPVKNGLPDGVWRGQILMEDTIRYIYNYSNGMFTGGVGIDKKGISHPFKEELIDAYYKGGEGAFRNLVRKKINHFNDSTGQRISLSNVSARFVVGNDGKINKAIVSGMDLTPLQRKVIEEMLLGIEWVPAKYVGIPVRQTLIRALKVGDNPFLFEEKRNELEINFRRVYYYFR